MIPRPTITEETLSEASRVFIATMQALDRRVSEEPLVVLRQEAQA